MRSSKCNQSMTILLSGSLIMVIGCQFGTDENASHKEGADKNKVLVENHAKLAASNQTLKDKLAKMTAAAQASEKERQRLEEKSTDLQTQVDRLAPEAPPLFKKGDLESGALSVRRIFSLRTGNCFDLAGSSSCLFWRKKGQPRSQANSALLYKTNLAFKIGSFPGSVSDPDGHPLGLVTPTIAVEIRNWELAHPNHPKLLGIR
jgi:hypothetical protein